jgi:hypothetical protein
MRQGEYYQTGLENSDHFGVPAESNVLSFPAEIIILPVDR